MARRFALLALVLPLLAACGHGGANHELTRHLLVVVNAPFSRTPYLGQAIENGTRLAAAQVNTVGITVGDTHYTLTVRTMDTGLSPARAVANVRRAVADGAVAIVDEGTGVDASWRIAARKGVPICIVFAGGRSLVDAHARPNVFRIAPTDHGIAFRLAEYLIPKRLKIGLLHDDSDYGTAGALELKRAFSGDRDSVALDETLPADALDLAPQVLRARRAHATALLVWGRPATIAAAITAARTAGWNVPFYTPPTGADPFVRQQLADHPAWVDGLTFAAGRLTAEVGAQPFENFAQRYAAAYGVDGVGVRTAADGSVTEPPETPMYAYDFVNLLARAITKAASVEPAEVTKALEQVTVEGANGDERGFNQSSHEGVVDDDVYFARFHDMTYAPVKDDPLSRTLPTVSQTR
ncbi:MAG TPA: ABC transporter substrate-binding protein [Gaiellaceae bacterium]|nr:ABC transporter substrate-binding protein [Gaiellaceae bacterium]